MVTTCSDVVAVDTLTGGIPWQVPVQEVRTRSDGALASSGRRIVMSDDVGTLLVLEPPSDDTK